MPSTTTVLGFPISTFTSRTVIHWSSKQASQIDTFLHIPSNRNLKPTALDYAPLLATLGLAHLQGVKNEEGDLVLDLVGRKIVNKAVKTQVKNRKAKARNKNNPYPSPISEPITTRTTTTTYPFPNSHSPSRLSPSLSHSQPSSSSPSTSPSLASARTSARISARTSARTSARPSPDPSAGFYSGPSRSAGSSAAAYADASAVLGSSNAGANANANATVNSSPYHTSIRPDRGPRPSTAINQSNNHLNASVANRNTIGCLQQAGVGQGSNTNVNATDAIHHNTSSFPERPNSQEVHNNITSLGAEPHNPFLFDSDIVNDASASMRHCNPGFGFSINNNPNRLFFEPASVPAPASAPRLNDGSTPSSASAPASASTSASVSASASAFIPGLNNDFDFDDFLNDAGFVDGADVNANTNTNANASVNSDAKAAANSDAISTANAYSNEPQQNLGNFGNQGNQDHDWNALNREIDWDAINWNAMECNTTNRGLGESIGGGDKSGGIDGGRLANGENSRGRGRDDSSGSGYTSDSATDQDPETEMIQDAHTVANQQDVKKGFADRGDAGVGLGLGLGRQDKGREKIRQVPKHPAQHVQHQLQNQHPVRQQHQRSISPVSSLTAPTGAEWERLLLYLPVVRMEMAKMAEIAGEM